MQMDEIPALHPNAEIKSQIEKFDFIQHCPTSRLTTCFHEIYRLWFNFPPNKPKSIDPSKSYTNLSINLRIYFFDNQTCDEYTLIARPRDTLYQLAKIAFGGELSRKIQVRESFFCI